MMKASSTETFEQFLQKKFGLTEVDYTPEFKKQIYALQKAPAKVVKPKKLRKSAPKRAKTKKKSKGRIGNGAVRKSRN